MATTERTIRRTEALFPVMSPKATTDYVNYGVPVDLVEEAGLLLLRHRQTRTVLGALHASSPTALGDLSLYGVTVAQLDVIGHKYGSRPEIMVTAVRLTPFPTDPCGCIFNFGGFTVRQCPAHEAEATTRVTTCYHGKRFDEPCQPCSDSAGAKAEEDRRMAEESQR